ncbi:hypothetical protein M409DRAFT_49135 [Zasmidium cellare ATCC 36951]|uniref:Transcription factor domain-containing protein n=1 Tax=Zasmidium cellare ATCC 36951 TaxID=1080233 RepID=A0A6A6D4E9_ZASCE|nr:uncharacterized protein M409DRAFT_49135 [Zasmidium cellare ATCC 36951]KAF2174277.1 hypothetical protein M409DRAFT_49135 [Zasmidium cellare ATCC 36951]
MSRTTVYLLRVALVSLHPILRLPRRHCMWYVYRRLIPAPPALFRAKPTLEVGVWPQISCLLNTARGLGPSSLPYAFQPLILECFVCQGIKNCTAKHTRLRTDASGPNYPFVNSTAGELRHDADAKRIVRSHAMKDFRARQRRARSSLEGTAPDTTSKPSRLTLALRGREGKGHLVDLDPDDFKESQPTDTTPVDSLSTLKPSTWSATTAGILQSPQQLQQMVGLCHEWFRWLRPDTQSDPNGNSTGMNADFTCCPTLLCSIYIAAIAGLDAADHRLPSGLEVLFKNRVIREIQTKIQSCSPAIMDQTMSALLFLIAHDFYRVDSSAVTHLRGLRSILCLNVERNPGMKWGAGLVIESMDLFIALWLDSDPLIVVDEEQHKQNCRYSAEDAIFSSQEDRRAHEAGDAFEEIARFLVYEQIASVEKVLTNNAAVRERKEGVIKILTSFNSCVDSHGKGCRDLYHYLSDKLFEQLAEFSENFCESMEDHEVENHHLARVGHQTLAILYNVMVNQHPFSHITNQGYVNGIAKAISALDQDWRPYPYLRFFGLLTGACAAKEQRTKAFFHTRLARSLRALEYSAWPDVKRFIIHFRHFKRSITPPLARPGRRQRSSLLVSNLGASRGAEVTRRARSPGMDELVQNGPLMWNSQTPDQQSQEIHYDSAIFQEAILRGLYWKTEAQPRAVM